MTNNFGIYADRTDTETMYLLLENTLKIGMLDALKKEVADPQQTGWVMHKRHTNGAVHLARPLEVEGGGFMMACCDIKHMFAVNDEGVKGFMEEEGIKPLRIGDTYSFKDGEGGDIVEFQPTSEVLPRLVGELEAELAVIQPKLTAAGESIEMMAIDQFHQLVARYKSLTNPMAKLMAAFSAAGIGVAIDTGIEGVAGMQFKPMDDNPGEDPKPTIH